MNKKTLFLTLLGLLAYPFNHISAQLTVFCGGVTGTPCVGGIYSLIPTIETAIWIIFGLIVVVCFVIAGIMFLTAQGAPEKLNTAKAAFIWGCVGVIVGIIAYSIVAIIGNFLIPSGGSYGGGSYQGSYSSGGLNINIHN